ncbi:MAG: 50S ribosomal protein L3 [Candidatus Midichloria mitochondrii]|nr:50S ribosomal protein L3 [Candidatus Midichloria mitochondrii]
MIKRCGAIVKKLGMSQLFIEDGRSLPVTILEFQNNVVLGSKNKDRHGYDAVIMGYGKAKLNKITKPMKGILAKAGVESVRGVKEFRVSGDCLIELGKVLSINHFVKGQYIDVTADSIGKGFAGAMKRHNFAGLEASHGVSVSHRSHGSTGNRTDPGKVFKGKKMAGHLGDERVTVQNLKIVDIDENLGVMAVLGAVPGAVGSEVIVRDAVKKGLSPAVQLPAVYAA